MMIRRIAAFLLTIALAGSATGLDGASAHASRNPFIAGKPADAPAENKPVSGYPAFLQPAMRKIAAVQYAIRQHMVRLAGDIRQHPFGGAFWMFMAFSLLYGMVHALGPGHGKVYACAYFLNRPGTIKRGLLLSGLTMIVHVLSGTVLILVGALVLKTSGAMTLENAGAMLERVSYGLLAGLGVFLTGNTVSELRANACYDRPDASDNKSLVAAALSVGIVPCPGAAMILLFSLTLGILPAGLGAMICIAAGMSITTGLFALATIVLKQRFLALAAGRRRLFGAAYAFFALGGAAGITAVGALLFIGSILG